MVLPIAAGGLVGLGVTAIANTAVTKEKPTNTGKAGDYKVTNSKNAVGGNVNTYWKWDGRDWTEVNENEYKQSTGNNQYVNKNEPDAQSVSTAVRYPADLSIDVDSDYVLFEFFEYVPPFGKGIQGQIAGDLSDNVERLLRAAIPGFGLAWDAGQGISKSIGIDTAKSRASEALALYNQSNNDERFYEKTSRSTLVMYMPQDISTGYRTQWSGKKFSNVARGALVTAGSDNILEMITEAGTAVARDKEKVIPNVANKMIRESITKITGEDISADEVFSSTRGVIVNPNVEMLFNGHDMRNFSLTYKLVPRNATEATNIKKIINTFRAAALPNFADGDEITFGQDLNIAQNFIKVPNVCKISFMRGGGLNPDVPQYKMCAMTQVDINYTPDGTYATYKDGTMVAYELQLSFQETKLIFSEEVEKY